VNSLTESKCHSFAHDGEPAKEACRDQLEIGAVWKVMTSMLPRVTDVRHLKEYVLEVSFSDGTVASLNFRGRIHDDISVLSVTPW